MKVIIINSGRIYDGIHRNIVFLSAIERNFEDDIYNYFKKNSDRKLSLPNLEICDLVVPEIYFSEEYYSILRSEKDMCIMKTNRGGFKTIDSTSKLPLLKEIFEYYRSKD